MAKAMEVSLTRVMTSLVTGGMTRLTICGKMILQKVCIRVNPSTSAASLCPVGTAWMPALKISPKYAA